MSPCSILGETLSGIFCRISLISSWRPRKIACIVNNIGTFVVDICVVALWKDFSQLETRVINVQSSSDSSYWWRSRFRVTNESIALQQSRARPGFSIQADILKIIKIMHEAFGVLMTTVFEHLKWAWEPCSLHRLPQFLGSLLCRFPWTSFGGAVGWNKHFKWFFVTKIN